MPAKWIDFRELKAQVSIRDVLAKYGYLDGLKDKGHGKLVGACPIHGGKNPNSFHVNVEKNVFNCFSRCGGGNILDLVSKVEECGVRDAGEKLAEWFALQFVRDNNKKANGSRQPTESAQASPALKRVDRVPRTEPSLEINPPLDHSLKTLAREHPYLKERGISKETIQTFDVGFCTRGLMKGRVAIAIHNERNELVAYAGRAIDDTLAKEEGKWKLPYGFQKARVVWNLNRATKNTGSGLIVVEGFFDAMKVHQAGFPNVVALMGSTMSEYQEELLVAATDSLALMFDGDDAGYEGLRKVYGRLRRKLFLKEVHLEVGEQPDSLSDERLKGLLG
ncbi:MAG TPA: toprim domain-containing protein [Candidatus Polarisedimenticolia bacterium]|jgi:DNA primase|nr:toprim domain-containing protein [Candidatus Polarisedimenticolia bacterium]